MTSAQAAPASPRFAPGMVIPLMVRDGNMRTKLKAIWRKIWIPEMTIGDLVSPIPRSDPARV